MQERKRPSFVRGRLNSFGYAWQGLASAFRSEVNMRWHVLSAFGAVALGLYLGLSIVEWALVVIAIGLVWVAELFNTALEVVVNLVSPGRHPLAGKAKDIAAGAVLVAALTAVGVGALVFGPYLWAVLQKWA